MNALSAMPKYMDFIHNKEHLADAGGFEPVWMPNFLYPFQASLVTWAVRKGRAAIFADCGLGKTPMQLVWAENVRRRTGRPVLVATPLAVGHQTIAEGEKFGIECARSTDGKVGGPITVTNYERLHHFSPDDFSGIVCDESSILKNFDGVRKATVTEFCRTLPYRLLCTATAAPNDYTELGTSSEALGHMGHMDMLTMFFRNVDGAVLGRANSFGFKHKERLDACRGQGRFWKFKRHGEEAFWRWVCSWARALRKPSDIGFEDSGFDLPPLEEREEVVKACRNLDGFLFPVPASCLKEERDEMRETVAQRCESAASKATHGDPVVVWCHLNEEGDLLTRLIPGAIQVKGSMSDEAKEEALLAFSRGQVRALVTKPRIGAFGLNWQHCAHQTFFPSHSYEQYYQAVRRCWRFGQTRPVVVDVITTEGGVGVLENLKRKAQAADAMFSQIVASMADELRLNRSNPFRTEEEIPKWLS